MAGPPVGVVKFVERIREGLQGMRRAMVPPHIAAMDFLSYPWAFQLVYVFVHLGLADQMSTSQPSESDALADALKLDRDACYRLLRACAGTGIIAEKPGRKFVLTRVGETLRADAPRSVRGFILFQGRVGWDLWGHLEECVRTGKTAIENRHGMEPFAFLNENPERAAVFNDAMSAISSFTADAVVGVYDFSKARKIADIGGGHGLLVSEIVKAHPGVHAYVFDLPEVVSSAPERERVEFVGGSFFEEVTVTDADLYLMKSIIHDWNDADAGKILRAVGAAMPEGAQLMLIELVVPESGENHLSKLLDIEMLVMAGGRERTGPEYRALLADNGFRLNRIIPTAGPGSLVLAEKSH